MIFPVKLRHADEEVDEEPFIVLLAVALIAGPSTIMAESGSRYELRNLRYKNNK
jgi:hypothetical protein